MSHHPYPETLPVDCITDIIGIVRRGEVRDNIADLANCVWTAIGYGLKVGVGEPTHDEQVAAAAALEDISDDQLSQCVAAMEEAHGDLETFAAAASPELSGLDPATLALLFQIGMQLFKLILERRKPK